VTTRNLLAVLLLFASACFARDFGECVNGAKRKGDKCVLTTIGDAAGTTDGGSTSSDGETPRADAAQDSGRDGQVDDAGTNDGGDIPSTDAGDAAMPGCARSTECDADAPICTDHVCSACARDEDCARFAKVALPACSSNGSCVECTDNEHCLDPLKPVCGTDNQCQAPCTGDLDCKRESNAWTTPYCELGTGHCVECIPGALEVEQCTNDLACDPVAKTCTGKPRQSVQNCYPCDTDTECAVGLYCVATLAAAAPNERYCVLRKDSGTCPNQFSFGRQSTSVLGVTAPFCFPDENLATCEAVLNFGAPCTTQGECPGGGLCEGTVGNKLCTYKCDGRSDCSTSCIGAEIRYCEPN